ncbi:MAG: glycosyltransferase family 2 protein [Candidatus Gastranaerophilales bacterium]|nr:glycosyltransferase family 2 protein [Candidatus Gastranaerophilales bacterium]
MLNGKKVVVIMPAYNAAKTLEKTYSEIAMDIVDEVILTDVNSADDTKLIAEKLNIDTIVHDVNLGYGANQKSCYRGALKAGADIIIMLHPDYQYTPKLIPAMVSMIAFEEYDAVIASRMLTGGALKGGMPMYKWIANKFLTFFQNIMMGQALSEYHTGFRAFNKQVLEMLPLEDCDDDFIFDNEMLALIFYHRFKIGEISCPTLYFPEASSINFMRSCKYGLGVLSVSFKYLLATLGVYKSKIFKKKAKRLNLSKTINYYHKKINDAES